MWSVFDEMGIFMAVCCHGFLLVITDMVWSGERWAKCLLLISSLTLYRAKYPLAVVSRLLDVFGKGLGGGYNISCKFKTMISRNSLVEPAQLLAYTSLIGSFHGHVHGHLCQLDYLATYIEGLGLKDLKGCEHCHAPNTFGIVNMEHTIDSSLSWSKRWVRPM